VKIGVLSGKKPEKPIKKLTTELEKKFQTELEKLEKEFGFDKY